MFALVRRTTTGAEQVRLRVLVPLVLGLLLLLAVFVTVTRVQQQQHSERSARVASEEVRRLLSEDVARNATALSGMLNAIENDGALAQAFKDRDRPALLRRAEPLFAVLSHQMAVTHFYFHLPDRTVLLRVHAPQLFGDKIDRQTLVAAERTGSIASGIERGVTGLFTLRVVAPWYQDGKLLGYLELGIEFADMLDRLHGLLDADFIVTVEKKYLDRDQWIRAERSKALDGRWDQFPNVVVVDNTMTDIPKPVVAFLSAGRPGSFAGFFSSGPQHFEVVTVPLTGMRHEEIGQILILKDASASVAAANKSIVIVAAVCFAVAGILAVGFYLYLGRIESRLTEQTGNLKNEIAERQRAERYLHLQFAVSKQLSEVVSAEDAMPKILHVLGEALGWRAGRWWQAEPVSQNLRCRAIWTAPALKNAERFTRSSREAAAPAGGLADRVRSTRQTVCVQEIDQAADPELLDAAQTFGINSAFAFPVTVVRDLAGVLEFFSAEPMPLGGEVSRILEAAAEQIGQFLERRRLEERLFETQKTQTIGQLAGGVAHEFNSILTAIIGQSELLVADLPPGNELTHKASEIRQAAERAAVLTQQLLAYGRKQTMRMEPVDLNRVLTRMEPMLRNLLGQSVDLRIMPDANLKPVKADAGQIEQVVVNMAINARDAMSGGGKLTLETARLSVEGDQASSYPELKPGRYIQLAITDTGTGMTPEVKRHMFEPFFSTKGVGQGTGLGLATCYGIIQQCGGHITVYSEPGRGTTFKIYLPEFPDQTVPVLPAPRPSAMTPGSETILLVEDDPALNDMAAGLLRRLGYTVFTATNGAEALQFATKEPRPAIDLLFTDVVIPGINGKQLADRMRESNPGLKILFTSAYTQNAIVHQGVLDPGVILLQKPFTPSLLAQKIRVTLDAGKPQP